MALVEAVAGPSGSSEQYSDADVKQQVLARLSTSFPDGASMDESNGRSAERSYLSFPPRGDPRQAAVGDHGRQGGGGPAEK